MRKNIKRTVPGLVKWTDPDEWFGIIQPIGGDLYEVLYPYRSEAEDANTEIGGTIVVVQTRIGADEDEEYVTPDESMRLQDGCRCNTYPCKYPLCNANRSEEMLKFD
jgi:hypothetical protein